MSPNKRVAEEMPIDRLSALPDSIIIRILSFLKVDESAITDVLSKRWRYLWTESPELEFVQGSLMGPDFVARVNRTLVTCSRRSQLDFFLVDFKYTKHFASDVSAWVQFVVSNKVKEVNLMLDTTEISDFYLLPQLMCSNSSLERLYLKGCAISPQRTIDWPSLTKLHIDGVKVQQHIIAKILSGCPVLSLIALTDCWGFNYLDIKSKDLYDIMICDRDYKGDGPLLEISAPYIRSLDVSLYPKGRKLRLTNIPSNVTATIDFIGSDIDFSSVMLMKNAEKLLGNIRHVKAVKLGANYVEVLSWMVIRYGYQFPQSTSRTSLTVYTDRDELGNVHGIVGLLESSPNIQELVIEGQDELGNVRPYNCAAAKGDLDRDLFHLKTVVIKNFVAPNLAGEPMLMLARILLKRAPLPEILSKSIIPSSLNDHAFKELYNFVAAAAAIMIRPFVIERLVKGYFFSFCYNHVKPGHIMVILGTSNSGTLDVSNYKG
ncbi:F-box/LRR-repeat protein at3g03360 [Phtheirospermum japonicum]|uniref:F-box/LRR-repeat protein at3g03360 n=1 Tax=Phtheirospermum japonicum TaxID=374723 RepID=A0A830AZE4_9LAMI|nr:F-box/LRR-repeat protein at3g03360 [Phtheirospermum japonicum]